MSNSILTISFENTVELKAKIVDLAHALGLVGVTETTTIPAVTADTVAAKTKATKKKLESVPQPETAPAPSSPLAPTPTSPEPELPPAAATTVTPTIEITKEVLAQELSPLIVKQSDKVRELFAKVGATRLSTVPAEKYGELYELIQTLKKSSVA